MKFLLTSVDSIVDSSTGRLFSNITKELDKYLSLGSSNAVVVISVRPEKLKAIPAKYNPTQIPFKLRGKGAELLEYIGKKTGVFGEMIVLGSKEHDMFTAAHTKSILLTAIYAQKNNPSDRIFTRNYGVPLNQVSSIGFFFESFYDIKDPWYMKVIVDKKTTLYALTNANTWGINGTPLGELKNRFRDCLKNDNDTYIIPFTSYFLVCTHLIMKDLDGIDYWDIYPSSKNDSTNNDLLFFAKKAAHSFNKEFKSDRLLLRTKNTTKRHEKPTAERIRIGCDEEFQSMVINDRYEGRLKGKSIGIIDDFTRLGTSCETARLLLEKAGVKKVIFIAMGKFGTDRQYHKYKYELTGSVFTGVRSRQVDHSVIEGTINQKSNLEFLNSLKGIA